MDVLIIFLICLPCGVLTIEYTVAQSSILATPNGPENAVDNIDYTCAVTEYGAGNYTIEVGNSLKVSDRHVCASEHLLFLSSRYTVNVSCKPAVHGDIIIVKRVDSGPLTLCNFKLRVCELGSQGKPCPMCTVDSTCRHCDQSHYGVSCEHTCSPGCVPGSCDQLTGKCDCITGFSGSNCEFLGELCLVLTFE
uniref:EGF-like domain-containing protein n=1 Tax=Magallana gigas TaxID=29159 RepID=A0A8W8N074_MAGGI